MTANAQHVIAVPIERALLRLPRALVAGSVDVALERLGHATNEWRWRSPSGGGRLAVSSLSATSTALVVTPDVGTSGRVADALTVELLGALERTWAPSVPPAAARPVRGRLRVAAAVVAVLVPVLAVVGSRVLAPPKPLDVAAAVAQFRDAAPAAPGAAGVADAAASGATGNRRAAKSGLAPPPAPSATTAGSGSRPVRAAASHAGTRASTSSSTPAQSSAMRTRQAPASGPQSPQRGPRQRSAPSVPAEGVYRYATRGYESIDQPSSRHDYPSETAMTIRHNDCGFVAHWQPLENRWDEMTICRSDTGSFIPTMATHREFYGQAKDSRYTCSDGFYAYRPQPGATWTGRCTDQESKMQMRAHTIGREAVRVGDQTVEAVRYVVEARISGDNEGTWRAERWIDPQTGLLLRAQAQTDATSTSSFGTVRYQEETDVRLLSMTPER